MRVPAVVGSWPEPFVHGFQGKRYPTDIACDGSTKPCGRVAAALRSAGVGATRQGDTGEKIEVFVGPWSSDRGRVDRRTCSSEGPDRSGVFARFVGTKKPLLELLNQQGQPAGSIGKGGGLIAALRPGDGPPTWVVTGTDAKGVAAAANLLGAELREPLRGRDPARRRGDRGARTVRPALAYTPGRSPLHRASPGAAIAYLGALAAIALRLLESARPGGRGRRRPCWPGSAAGARRAVIGLAAAGAVRCSS